MPWLDEQALTSARSSPTFTLQDKARAIFYNEWILQPCNHGVSPGYLDVLPVVVAETAETSALRVAVDAFALANIQQLTIQNGNLKDMARAKYGQALAALRKAVDEGSLESEDSILLAILTIDMFEVHYLVVFTNRGDPLGLHSSAVEHILTLRDGKNICSLRTFSLYRTAHHRLQSRQLLQSRGPLPVQLNCIKSLNLSEAALDLGRVLLEAQQALFISKQLIDNNEADAATRKEQASVSRHRIEHSFQKLDRWSKDMPESWKPRIHQIAESRELQQLFTFTTLPPIPQVRIYHDPWIAYQTNFFYQGQLALRSALMDTLAWNNPIIPGGDLEEQLKLIAEFSDDMVESIPPLIVGSTDIHISVIETCHDKKISQCFAQEACWTLQQMNHVPMDHKNVADRATLWLQRSGGGD